MLMAKCSGSLGHRVIWEQLNTSEDQPAKVIGRLDAMISTQVTTELEGLMERPKALKAQKACRVYKSIAMKRSIDMVQSRPCQIDREVLTENFGWSWAQEVDRFEEAREGAEFCRETQIREAEQEELETFMPDGKKIRDVIKSRQDLSVNGVDEIGHRIVRAAGKQGVTFMRVLIGVCIRDGASPIPGIRRGQCCPTRREAERRFGIGDPSRLPIVSIEFSVDDGTILAGAELEDAPMLRCSDVPITRRDLSRRQTGVASARSF
jgi:hypothetical protein